MWLLPVERKVVVVNFSGVVFRLHLRHLMNMQTTTENVK